MRDIDRIEPFLDRLKELWKQNYDLRFFQVVEMLKIQLKREGYQIAFYVEEPETQAAIEKLLTDDVPTD